MYNISTRDIIKVCFLYYEENRTKQEISKIMEISRFKVGRLLSQAKKEGIISIHIHDPLDDIAELEIKLAKKFSLKEAVIVSSSEILGKSESEQIGRSGAQYLSRVISGIKILSVAWGITLRHLVENMEKIEAKDLTVVTLSGSIGSIGGTDTNMLTMMLSEKLSARPLLLQAPLLVRDKKTRHAFLKEKNIAETLSIAKSADMTLLGIGLASKKGSLHKVGLLKGMDYQKMVNNGAVGAICGRFYDIDGNPCITDWDSRVIGPTLEELCKIKHKVAIAGGGAKKDAIIGALKGRYLDVLITDENTARSLLF